MIWKRTGCMLAGYLAVMGCATGTGPPAGVAYVQISAGRSHTCAIATSGRAYCWGSNVYGALGDGTTEPRAAPVLVVGELRFRSISAGYDHTCAVATSGVVYCWGMNFGGQLGDGSTMHRTTPTQVAGARTFRSVSAGEAHTCAVAVQGDALCWGAPVGPGPDGNLLPSLLVPTSLGTPSFSEIDSGYEIVCALTAAGAPYCWGLFPPGVSFPDTTQSSAGYPLPVDANGLVFVSVSAANKHACALRDGGDAYCWGRNGSGQVGIGSTVDAQTPQLVVGGLRFSSVSARGPTHSCGIVLDGTGYCWGSNAFGQLGSGSGSSSTAPMAISGALEFVSLSTGFYHSCGVTRDGRAYCWGYGGFGQLGTGEFDDALTPVAVAAP